MLLLRGISDLASNPTEVLAVSAPAWLPGATRDPEPTMFSDIPQFPFKTDTSQCVLPAASSLGTVVSPRFGGGRLPSSPNSAIGTSSTHAYTHIHTHTRTRKAGRQAGWHAAWVAKPYVSAALQFPAWPIASSEHTHAVVPYHHLSAHKSVGFLRADGFARRIVP